MEPDKPFIHSTAIVKNPELLGDGTVVWAYASLHEGVKTGINCSIGERAYIGKYTVLGDRTRVGEKAHVTDHMRVGAGVFISPMVVTTNDKHPIVNNPQFKLEPSTIEDDVSVGAGAVLLPGVRLGRGCVIGAGAVVTKDVPSHETWVGNPARPLHQSELKGLQGL